MFPHTTLEPQDDPAFLAVVDRVLAVLVQRDRPEEVYLVHLDNWFDHKWLRYSGYGNLLSDVGYPYFPTIRQELWQDRLTFPPFNPNRTVAQYFFARIAEDTYEEQAPAHLVHPRQRQRSGRNLHRRVADFCSSGLFVWYSSASASNRRGSLLVYSVKSGEVGAWYASLSERQGWRLDLVKGISREMVTGWLGGG